MANRFLPDGRFQSNKFPDLPPDHVAFKITHETAGALLCLAQIYSAKDPEFAADLAHRACVKIVAGRAIQEPAGEG